MSTKEGLITVQEFAERYRVSPETVRLWVKKGNINYELVGTRKMIRKSEVLKLLEPEDPIV